MNEKKHTSLDPRINRIELPYEETQTHEEGDLMQWQTYEVFQQRNRGDQHMHVGSLHAPNPDMALVLAKEQFGRREQCANLWVVKTRDVHATSYEDADMFQHAFDKSYREGDGYKVKITIEKFQKQLFDSLDEQQGRKKAAEGAESPKENTITIEDGSEYKIYNLPSQGKGVRKILVKK